MRDDFSLKRKETLSKRVSLNCSNPECRRLTVGPNSQNDKTTNIGVAAHITAASSGGPRFDDTLTSDQRKSISNGIWLCQSCSKLIDSDVQQYTAELLMDWKDKAERYSKSLLNEQKPENIRQSRVLSHMPDLVKEMKVDLKSNPLAREFVLLSKSWRYNDSKGILYYYFEDHENLEIKMKALEGIGLVNEITWNNTKRYELTEEFIDLLLK